MADHHNTGPALPSDVPATVDQAVQALRWPGLIVPDVALLGTVTTMVVTFDHAAHQLRQDSHTAQPVLDTDTLAMWEWPQARGTFPPTVITIAGVLAHGSQPVKAHAATARRWRGFAATAILLPTGKRLSAPQQLECAYSGIAVLADTSNGVDVLHHGAPERLATARRTVADRWVEEHLYAMVLNRAESSSPLLPLQRR